MIKAVLSSLDIVSDFNIAVNPRTMIAALIAPFSGTQTTFRFLLQSIVYNDLIVLSRYYYITEDEAKALLNDHEKTKYMPLKRFWWFIRDSIDLFGIETIDDKGEMNMEAKRE